MHTCPACGKVFHLRTDAKHPYEMLCFFCEKENKGNKMKLFLDTEFTSLDHEAKLISIALVNENEDGFYAELTDTYSMDDCSWFVKTIVLPGLKGKDFQMTFNECALKLASFIEDHDERCIIVSDAPSWDMPFLRKLLEPMWPENLEENQVHTIFVPDAIKTEIFKDTNLYEHNALSDAIMMRRAFAKKDNNR